MRHGRYSPRPFSRKAVDRAPSSGHKENGTKVLIYTYQNPGHREPHRPAEPHLVAGQKGNYRPNETPQIVDSDNDANDGAAGEVNLAQKVLVAHNPGKDTLIVAWKSLVAMSVKVIHKTQRYVRRMGSRTEQNKSYLAG